MHSEKEKIESYLVRLSAELEARAVNGRSDIVQEIRGYLADAEQGGETKLQSALADLGTPKELAQTYHAEVGSGDAARPADRRQLLIPLRGKIGRSGVAAASALASISLFATCAVFASLVLLKLFRPEGIPGLVGKFNLGALVQTPQAHEIFGWILLPFGLLMATLCFFAATQLLKKAARDLPSFHSSHSSSSHSSGIRTHFF